MSIFKIRGVIQHYAWGGEKFIPKLLNLPESGEKFAEYWMGAHDKGPAFIEGSDLTLDAYIRQDPVKVLGDQVYEKFGQLPFLFKVLDVNDMLSIQVHPSKPAAERGFARENAEGIPLSAPHRNYKDDNHKPEIMVALSDFWLLHGFKPAKELVQTLKATPELSHLVSVFENTSYQGLYQAVMEEPAEKTQTVLEPLIRRVLPKCEADRPDKSNPDYWAAKAFKTFCKNGSLDKGIYSIYFFNIVLAQPGQAVFQAAGIPHAYLEGQTMELMANSDNVLRGGLTPKHVDVPELLKQVTFQATSPRLLKGEVQPDGVERIFKSPAPDFELSHLCMAAGDYSQYQSKSLEILIVMEGSVQVFAAGKQLSLTRGEAVAVISGTEYSIQAEAQAILFKARYPL